jgi:hypothetical protein
MKKIGTDRTLESFKVFPYLAWGLVIIFTAVVYNITLHLRIAASELKTQTEFTQMQAHTDPTQIKNFEKPPFKEGAAVAQ